MSAVASEGQEKSLWGFLSPELLTHIFSKVLQRPVCPSSVTGLRQACPHWRNVIDAAIKTIRLDRDTDLSSANFERFTHVRQIQNLPTGSLCSLIVGTSLESLPLRGTGSDREYAVLAQLPALRCLHLGGPVVMTTERLCMLGIQPELQILKLEQVLFPGAHTSHMFSRQQHSHAYRLWNCLVETLGLGMVRSLAWHRASFWVLSSR